MHVCVCANRIIITHGATGTTVKKNFPELVCIQWNTASRTYICNVSGNYLAITLDMTVRAHCYLSDAQSVAMNDFHVMDETVRAFDHRQLPYS
jgi:hypothetical protein